MKEDLLGIEARDLLKKFGAGGHVPGSGSAAALLGLISLQLCRTGIALTSGRPGYEQSAPQIEFYEPRLAELDDVLEDFFQQDSDVFDQVIQLRNQRDRTEVGSPERRKVNDRLAVAQWEATDLPLSMVQPLLELGAIGIQIFQLGFRSARGDAALAVYAAQAAASGCLSIAALNLQTTRDRRRTRAALDAVESHRSLVRAQATDLERVESILLQEARNKNSTAAASQASTRVGPRHAAEQLGLDVAAEDLAPTPDSN